MYLMKAFGDLSGKRVLDAGCGRGCYAKRLLAAYPLVDNRAVQEYVNQVGRYLAAQGPRPIVYSVCCSNVPSPLPRSTLT